MRKANDPADELLAFIGRCTSPFHVVTEIAARLRRAGFQELRREESWEKKLACGGRYFVDVYGSSLIAFSVGALPGALRMAAAHTDFPCFRVKPLAAMVQDGYGSLNVEPYGGLILRTWLDRPLGLAGKVVLRGASPFQPEVRLVDFRKPLLVIPSLAIHMDREVNEAGALNAQKDMLPLAALLDGAEGKERCKTKEEEMRHTEEEQGFFLTWLAKACGAETQDVLSYELGAYPVEEGCALGLSGEFVSAPRLDNLTSVLACLKGLEKARSSEGIRLAAFFDNEEVGSRTKQGAGSTVLHEVLRRIYCACGLTEEVLSQDLAKGFLLSVDVAHGLHPSHRDKSDPSAHPVLGGGVVLKQAASQAYAGDAEAVAVIRALAEAAAIPCQMFVNRSDSRGGSTLGAIASSFVPVRTMDIGLPVLAMHSACETMGIGDQAALEKLLQAFFA